MQTTQRLLRGDLHGGGDGGRPRGMGLCLEQVTSNQRGRGEGDADERTWTVPKTMATVEVFPVCLSVCLSVRLSLSVCPSRFLSVCLTVYVSIFLLHASITLGSYCLFSFFIIIISSFANSAIVMFWHLFILHSKQNK